MLFFSVCRCNRHGPKSQPARIIKLSDKVKMTVDASTASSQTTTQEELVIYIFDAMSLLRPTSVAAYLGAAGTHLAP